MGTLIPGRDSGPRLPDLAKKAPIRLLLAAVGSLKFGFALLLFGLLFESLATTASDLGGFLLDTFFVLMLQNQSIHRMINVCSA